MNWLSDSHQVFLNQYYEAKEKIYIDIESHIFGLFQIDLKKEIANQFVYLKYAGLQPSEIKQMVYWEWQMMLEELNDYMEKEKEAREKEEGKSSGNYTQSKEYKDVQGHMKGMGINSNRLSGNNAMPSMPNIGNFGNMPKF